MKIVISHPELQYKAVFRISADEYIQMDLPASTLEGMANTFCENVTAQLQAIKVKEGDSNAVRETDNRDTA